MGDSKPPSIISRLLLTVGGLLLAVWLLKVTLDVLASLWLGIVIVLVITAVIAAVIWWVRNHIG